MSLKEFNGTWYKANKGFLDSINPHRKCMDCRNLHDSAYGKKMLWCGRTGTVKKLTDTCKQFKQR